MELIQMGEFAYEIFQMDNCKWKFVLHDEDGEVVAWDTAASHHDARVKLCNAILALLSQA